jgi:ribosome biogenesis GTPase
MRELGLITQSDTLDEVFGDISALSRECRFRNCSHNTELGCAVREAIRSDQLDERRLRNYFKLQREAMHAKEAKFEKRARERNLGRNYRAMISSKRDH